MKSLAAKALINKIDSTIDEIKSFSGASDSEKSYLAKFLVVFISGIYEETIEAIINERASKCKDAELANFIGDAIDSRFRNPDVANVKGLLGKFSKAWCLRIGALPSISLDALDSIVGDKNAISHGHDSTLTLTEVIKYHEDAKKVIQEIDAIFYK